MMTPSLHSRDLPDTDVSLCAQQGYGTVVRHSPGILGKTGSGPAFEHWSFTLIARSDHFQLDRPGRSATPHLEETAVKTCV